MNSLDYKNERKLRGTQCEIAAQLDVRQATISGRETGAMAISKEAWLALLSLPKKNERKSHKFSAFRI